MQEVSNNDSTPQRPAGGRVIDALQVNIDLPFYIDQIRKEPAWKNSDRNAITVFKSNKLRLVLIAMQEGAVMAKHIAPGMIHLQVLEGDLLFMANEESSLLKPGQIVVLHEGIPHSVTAKSELVFLLSISVS